jgi:hypothetical protein
MAPLVLRVDPRVQVVISLLKCAGFILVELREPKGQPGKAVTLTPLNTGLAGNFCLEIAAQSSVTAAGAVAVE